MKVIFLNDFGAVNGGAAQVAITEALWLAEDSHEVVFFYGAGPADPRMQSHPNIQVVKADNFDVLEEPNRVKAAVKAIWNQQAAKQLNSVLSEALPGETIVHLHGWHRSLSPSVAAVVRRKKLPLICTVHDYFLACPNGGFYNFQTNKPCTLKALSPACLLEHCDPRLYRHKLWRYGRMLTQRNLVKLPNKDMAFITVSDFSRTIIQPYLSHGSPIYDLSNPIATPSSAKVRVSENQSYTYAGRLSKDKGPLLLAQANHDQKFKLTFIGEGSEKEQIQSTDHNARLTGWLAREALFSELSKTRALIFTTLGYETQGMTVLEAASMGIPAIVSDSSAATSWVKDGYNGLWFRQGDPEDLRRKMMLVENDDLLSRLGTAAHEKFWSHPNSPQQHVERLTEIYEEVLRQ